ncbi:hypothetical protein [Nocardioides sp. MH1]|uniref:hypothetical protein n=1 Tax=Nocardioides sp. MH1 TaxID=3242490 RepID=UPI003520C797
MTSPPRRWAVALGAALAATVLVPTAASAERATLHDRAHDVVDEGRGDAVVRRAASPDIVAAHVRHTMRDIIVRTEYRDLRRGPDQVTQALIVIHHEVYGAVVTTSRAHPGGTVAFGGDSGPIRCDVPVAHHVSYRHDVVRIVVPRVCLGDPRRIQVAVTAWRGELVDEAGQDGRDGLGPPAYTRELRPR